MNAPDSHTPPEVRWGYAALQAAMESVERVAPDRWFVSLRGRAAPRLLVEAVDGFLILSGGLLPGSLPSRWDLLKANASLLGFLKFASMPDGNVSLRAEIPVRAESALSRRIDQTCRAFANALSPVQAPREAPAASAEVPSPDLAKLCEEAGWQCSSRRGGRCAVPLDAHQGAHTALISERDGCAQVCTELASWDSLPGHCREGLSAFLLAANARLRLARTIVTEDEAGGAALLEVLLETPTSSAEIGCTLEALSVGAELCAPVADILQHEEAAKLFLSVRGGPRTIEKMQQTTKRKL